MILETIITTPSADGSTHIAPMGVHLAGEQFLLPGGEFKPCQACHVLDISYRYLHGANSQKIC